MNARTYTVGSARVLDLPGSVDLVLNLKTHPAGTADISAGIFESHTANQPFRPALAWTMGTRAVLQDDAQGDEAHAALWINDTSFRLSVAHVPALMNFLGDLLRDIRHATTAAEKRA